MNFLDCQRVLSRNSIYEIRVRDAAGAIEIHLRAFNDFFPLSLSNTPLRLVSHADGVVRMFDGVMALIDHSDNRGCWYHYRFTPDSESDLQGITFYGELRWCSVKQVIFFMGDGNLAREMSNPFSEEEEKLRMRFS